MKHFKWKVNRERVSGRMPKLCEDSQLNWKRLKTSIFWYKLPQDLHYIYRKMGLKGTPQYGKLLIALGMDKGFLVTTGPYKLCLRIELGPKEPGKTIYTEGPTQKGCVNQLIHRFYVRKEKIATADNLGAS